MSALMNIPRNGQAHKNSGLTHRGWSNWIDDLFNTEAIPSVFANEFSTGFSMPKVNIMETNDDYFIELAVPGFKKDDFNIDLDNEVLSISTEHKEETETSEGNYTRKEFGYSSFKRTFSLPEYIDESKIKATYEEGILTVKLPKREEAKPKPSRTIEIS
ncbi:Hsp20/alpha crystallin family protein [Hyunsoonleella sp. SJ7]|uniref:Hsp20/alpha crystallin family protein n=1 Tax=Hyunsoonleella aquatilis TaxID=2762758 RepID=A0A923HIC1_9FLAO|nr:Hsp20/alpha crystallin family protein [Hyunsoonleella aquatilis]MBC3758897.1 Hsp20/alpha crystallin family protein [Hyunsoonleella aquatilis]